MAIQESSPSNVEISSFIRGFHAYKEQWTPHIGEELTLEREPGNHKDKLAVAVVKSGTTVGHVPYNLAPVFSHFLSRLDHSGSVEVTGSKVNGGGGYGLEIPCKYRLSGSPQNIQRLKKLLDNI